MTLQLINPESLPTPTTYTHVIVATGSKTVFVAGQEPEDVQGNLVGPGDLAAHPAGGFRLVHRHAGERPAGEVRPADRLYLLPSR